MAVLAMAVVYEGLKFARVWLKQAAIKRILNHQQDSRSETPVDDEHMLLTTPAFLTGLVYRSTLLLHQVNVHLFDPVEINRYILCM